MARRYFCNILHTGVQNVMLDSENAHHISTVLRAKCGDTVILCDGKGFDYNACITKIEKNAVHVEINTCVKNVSEPSVAVNIYVGYPKQDKLEQIVQKATELGAVSVTPFYSKYCVVTHKKDKDDKKTDRLQKIALEAAKQSGRGIIPCINKPLAFKDMLKAAKSSDLTLLCYEDEKQSPPLHSRINDSLKTIAVITGSEGGFSADEVEKARENGIFTVGLGPRILRCETAPIAVVSAIMAFTGNLQ